MIESSAVAPDLQRFVPPFIPVGSRPAFFELAQFVNWRPEWNPEKAKYEKRPWNYVTGEKLKHGSRSSWMTYDQAVASRLPYGFIFTPECEFGPIDLDNCWDVTTGDYTRPEARAIIADATALEGGAVAWEFSQSGTGFHIVGRVDRLMLNRVAHKRDGWAEQYAGSHRFIAFGSTGWKGAGTANISPVVLNHWPEKRFVLNDGTLTNVPAAGYDGYEDDDELLRHFRMSQSIAGAFGESVTNADVFDAFEASLSRQFPSNNFADPFDRSSADFSLAARLAWWTGNNGERIARLMRRSRLARPKWDEPRGERGNYLTTTVTRAVSLNENVMNKAIFKEERRRKQIEEIRRIGDDKNFDGERLFARKMTLDQMLSTLIFVGHGTGATIERDTFRVRSLTLAAREYAASRTPVPTDEIDPKTGKTIIEDRPTFPMWSSHEDRQGVDVLVWAPGKSQFCEPPERMKSGDLGFNTWRGIQPPCPVPLNWQDYIVYFTEHIEYLVPDASERDRFVKWLAHMFQKPEELPHTYYLMIAETHGIGRNLLAAWLTYALRGYVAAGVDLAQVLDGGFNGRLSEKLLCTVDEVLVGASAKRYEYENALRSFSNQTHRHINEKYGSQSVEYNCARWLLFSNHLDAIPLSNKDRRAIVIRNPTEVRREEYYASQYALVGNAAFTASLWHYLTNVISLETFNAGAHAPMNDVKVRLLDSLKTETDHAIEDKLAEWSAPIAWRSTFTASLPSGSKDSHAKNALRDAGIIVVSDRRVKVHGGRRETVCLLPARVGIPTMTPDELARLSDDQVRTMITSAEYGGSPPGQMPGL